MYMTGQNQMMNDKILKVHSSIHTVLKEKEIPAFEINAKTIDMLNDLMQRNESKDIEIKIVTQELAERRVEYKCETQKLQSILSSVGLAFDALPQCSHTALKILADTALLLQLKDTSMTSYLLGINHLSYQLHLTSKLSRDLNHATRKLRRKTEKALTEYRLLKKSWEYLEQQMLLQQPLMKQKISETDFLRKKTSEYEQQLYQFNTLQENVNLKPDLHHKTLVRKQEEIVNIEDEIKPLKTMLISYHSLPPDMSLTKVKLEEAKIELERLEEQFMKHIELMQT